MATKKEKRIESLKRLLKTIKENSDGNEFKIDGITFQFRKLRLAFEALHSEDKMLLDKYFVNKKTQEAIAQESGISQPIVNRRIKEALSCIERSLFFGIESVEKS